MPAPVQTCATCGSSLPGNALDGLCPRCLAGAFLDHTDSLGNVVGAFDGYEIAQPLAQGGMGVVHRARDPVIEREVVVKFLRPDRRHDGASLDRFLNEARVTGQLEHPSIVPVYHLGVAADGRPFYAMRRIEGDSLAAVLERLARGDAETVARYPLVALLTVLQKICDAVAFAHSRGIVHRDLKPENVMLGPFGEVVVMDWGLAKNLRGPVEPPVAGAEAVEARRENFAPASAAGEFLELTRADTVLGTPGFMAPEQAGGQSHRADERADIYALGAILYAMLTLRAPVAGKDAHSILGHARAGHITPPTDYNPGGAATGAALPLPHCPNRRVPPALSAVTMKALATDPADRYPTVKAFQEELTAYLNGFVTSAERAGVGRLLWLWVLRHKTITAAAVVLLLVVSSFTWRINLTIADLRGTAPAFFALAQSSATSQKFDEALAQVNQALTLTPQRADYLLFKAHLLQAVLRLDEAAAAYAEALALDPALDAARNNLALTHDMQARRNAAGEWSTELLTELYENVAQQKRPAEAYAIARHLDLADQRLIGRLQARLTAAGFTNRIYREHNRPPGLGSRLEGDRMVKQPRRSWYLCLKFETGEITDLSPLAGMPLQELVLVNCSNVTDLTPLRGMPLVELTVVSCKVADLSPLEGMPLEYLNIGFLRVEDLTPLRTLTSLRELSIGNLDVFDLSPIQNLPLEEFGMASTRVTSLEPLRQMKKLASFRMTYCGVADLSPLRDAPLRVVYLSHVPVSDISVLRNKVLRHALFPECYDLRDLSPLANCRSLGRVILPPNAENFEFLRDPQKFPYLKDLNYLEENFYLSPAEFWRAYDARKNSAK
jgi:serine/threonine protein kinase